MSPLVATTPLHVLPDDRSVAERALTALSRCRFVSRASLLAAMGPSGLRDELIDGWVAAGLIFQGTVTLDPLQPEPTPYLALTRQGARALSAATGASAEGLSASLLKRPSQKRGHDVCVGEVALSVLTLAAEGNIELVGIETDDKRLAVSTVLAEPGESPERITLRPDGLALAEGSFGKTALVLEVDRGTISLETMGRRYAGYMTWYRQGGPETDFGIKALRVVTVVPTEARLKALHDAALKASRGKPSGFLLFALQDDLTVCVAERMLEPVARPLGAAPGFLVPLLPRRPARAGAAA
jgi:hypothetical protein